MCNVYLTQSNFIKEMTQLNTLVIMTDQVQYLELKQLGFQGLWVDWHIILAIPKFSLTKLNWNLMRSALILNIFLAAAVESIFDIGCNVFDFSEGCDSHSNVAEYPRFLVCEAFSLGEYFPTFWRHQDSSKSWGVLAQWHSMPLRWLRISEWFLFLVCYAVGFSGLLPIWIWLDRQNTSLLCLTVSVIFRMLQKQSLFAILCTLSHMTKT